MGDDCSIVAYVCNPDKQYDLSTFPPNISWNSKKWRTMVYINKDLDLIMAGKAYPFSADDITEIVLDAVAKIIDKPFSKMQKLENRRETKLHMSDHASNSVHYNDCLLASGFYGYMEKAVTNPEKIIVGSYPVCIHCGENVVIQPNGFACKHCGCYEECEICGSALGVYEDDTFQLDGMRVCEDCFEERAVYCNECGDEYDKDSEEVIYDDIEGEFYCRHCYSEILEDRTSQVVDDDWFDM